VKKKIGWVISGVTMPESVLLDTSFFLRFLNKNDELFSNADGYYKYFLEKEIAMVVSTISIAEFCVRGSIEELPLKNLQILPFNVNHAKKTGEFARALFEARQKGELEQTERLLISNDSKLFAQADQESQIKHFVTSDIRSLKPFTVLKATIELKFDIINISQKHTEAFGTLGL
jgi:predicted nucleic acid-binding protein